MTEAYPLQPLPTQTRVVTLKTNLNRKLGSPRFCHIQIGLHRIPESVAESTIVKFVTEDKSYGPVNTRLVDSVRQPLGELSSVFTWLSHNMDKDDFIIKVLTEVPGTTLNTEMAVYFYTAISD